jgi:hypothetical protein
MSTITRITASVIRSQKRLVLSHFPLVDIMAPLSFQYPHFSILKRIEKGHELLPLPARKVYLRKPTPLSGNAPGHIHATHSLLPQQCINVSLV